MASPAAYAATPLREMKWSPAEKAVARRAFDLALRRELEAVVREAKDRAAKIQEASELWELERWLTQRRTGDRPQVRLPLLRPPARPRDPPQRRTPRRRRPARPRARQAPSPSAA